MPKTAIEVIDRNKSSMELYDEALEPFVQATINSDGVYDLPQDACGTGAARSLAITACKYYGFMNSLLVKESELVADPKMVEPTFIELSSYAGRKAIATVFERSENGERSPTLLRLIEQAAQLEMNPVVVDYTAVEVTEVASYPDPEGGTVVVTPSLASAI